MNRVLVYGLSSDKMGGIETFLLNMNQFMNDLVFDYIIEGDSTIHQGRIDKKGGKTYFISPKRLMLSNIKNWRRVLKEYDDKQNLKVVYFNMFSLAWIVPIIQCRLYGYRVIVHAHNNMLHDCGIALKTLHNINRNILKYIRITRLTNSQLSAKFFFGEKPAEMIYNAIDTARFAFNEAERNIIRKELNIDNKHVYGFAGRIAYQKNPLFLMEIFKKIMEKDPDAAFIVCGDGDLMKQVRDKADAYGLDILFLGIVSEVEKYYQAMDVFILPSRFEGLGIVLIEAQCCGLPCVASLNVIPKDAKVSDLVKFVRLEDDSSIWADIAIGQVGKTEREKYVGIIKETRFEIRREAKRLEKTLIIS